MGGKSSKSKKSKPIAISKPLPPNRLPTPKHVASINKGPFLPNSPSSNLINSSDAGVIAKSEPLKKSIPLPDSRSVNDTKAEPRSLTSVNPEQVVLKSPPQANGQADLALVKLEALSVLVKGYV